MISDALRLIRVFHDLSQSQLADRIKISQPMLSQLENGLMEPSLGRLEEYAVEFRLPVSAILFFAEKIYSIRHREVVGYKVAQVDVDLMKLIEMRVVLTELQLEALQQTNMTGKDND